MTRVVVLAYDGVDELDLVGVVGPLRKVEPRGTLDVTVVAPSSRVVTSGGMTMGADCLVEERAAFDALVLPGGRTAATTDLSVFEPLIRRARRDAVPVYAVCTGLLLLARLERLGVDPLPVHHAKESLLRATGYEGEIVEGVVRHPGLVCVAGRGCANTRPVTLALELIRDLAGDEALARVAARMELDLPVEAAR